MEAVRAYYDGKYFIPMTKPKSLRKNQEAIITILDDPTVVPATRTQMLLASLEGRYPELSSHDFAMRKQAEKEADL